MGCAAQGYGITMVCSIFKDGVFNCVPINILEKYS